MGVVNKATKAYGVDIAIYQQNWAPTGKEAFVFVKATEGQSYVSPTMRRQVDLARASGAVVGFYHFLWPSAKSGTPAVQAKWFVDNAKPEKGDLLVCDWETVANAGVPTEKDKDEFMAAVKKLRPDLKVGLYVNRSMWNASNKNKGDFLWLAEYAANPTIDEWDFWQYTDKPIDQNVARFATRQELVNWITPIVTKPKPTLPTKPAAEAPINELPVEDEDILPRLSDEDVKRIAKAVWDSDIIPAPTKSKSNPTWKASSYLKEILNKK